MFSENVSTEFKREYTPDIVKTVLAFANTIGGTIYVGIADDGGIVGVADVDATMLRVGNAVRDAIKPDVTMFVDCRPQVMSGKNIVEVVVQKGTASPYYLAGKGIRPEGVFVRQGASSVPATETAILRMIKETDGERYEDVRSLNQDLTFVEAEVEFKARDLPFGVAQQRTLGLINDDGMYTNLALLLSDQCIHTIKLAVYAGTTKVQFQDRREFTGSLLKQLNDVYAFIDRYNRIRSEIEGLHRVDRRDYPTEAVREALLNALVHRDYAFRDSTLVSVFDDRIEFVSIGGLVRGITLEDMMLGISVARNRNLAAVFYRLALIEAYGTGIPKMMRSYEEYTVRPEIRATDNAFKITLPNINEAAERPTPSELNENERAVLRLFEGGGAVVRRDVEAALGVSQSMASRVLRGLVDKGRVRAVGGGKNTKYVPLHITAAR